MRDVWSHAERRLLTELAKNNASPEDAATQLGRTRKAVMKKAWLMGLALRSRPRPAQVKVERATWAGEHPIVSMVRVELEARPDIAPDPVADSLPPHLTIGPMVMRRRAWPRHLAAYIANVELGLSQTEAARIIGGDRRTVREGVPRIEDRRDDPWFDAFIDSLAERAREIAA